MCNQLELALNNSTTLYGLTYVYHCLGIFGTIVAPMK